MDHLLRQAAASFEVPPVGADWDKVAADLDAEEVLQKESNAWAHSRRYGLLMLFMMASLVCNKYLFLNFNKYNNRQQSATTFHNSNIQNFETVLEEKEVVSFNNKASNNLENVDVVKLNGKQNVSNSFYNFKKGEIIQIRAESKLSKEKTDVSFSQQKMTIVERDKSWQNLGLEELKTLSIPFVNAEPLIEEKESAIEEEPSFKRKNRRFYLGAVAGLDFSTVKFQESSDLGFTAGLLAGYQLNKKWAIETGLLWDKKNYYTSGQHFNTSKLSLPSHTNILYAVGYCNMYEIPLNVRYQFGSAKNHSWFVAAGASSYLMQKEDYHYEYERYGVTYYSNKTYKASSKNWFSVANISGGYIREMAGGLNIRVEPYLKLPIKGMGIGSLPITSAGIQVGVTYPVH